MALAVSAHEILQSHDCSHPSCFSEAEKGSDRCSRHPRVIEASSQHVTVCVCGAQYVGTELRGRGWLSAHERFCRKVKAQQALGEPEESTQRRVSPNPSAPFSGSPSALGEADVWEGERVSRPITQASVAPSAPDPEPSRPREPDVPQPAKTEKEITVKSKMTGTEEAEFIAAALVRFHSFHERYGRWPLPADSAELSDTGVLPSFRFTGDHLQGGWQRLWDAADAGTIPRGGAARNYRDAHPIRTVTEYPKFAPLPKTKVGVVSGDVEFLTVASELERRHMDLMVAEAAYQEAIKAFRAHPFVQEIGRALVEGAG